MFHSEHPTSILHESIDPLSPTLREDRLWYTLSPSIAPPHPFHIVARCTKQCEGDCKGVCPQGPISWVRCQVHHRFEAGLTHPLKPRFLHSTSPGRKGRKPCRWTPRLPANAKINSIPRRPVSGDKLELKTNGCREILQIRGSHVRGGINSPNV